MKQTVVLRHVSLSSPVARDPPTTQNHQRPFMLCRETTFQYTDRSACPGVFKELHQICQDELKGILTEIVQEMFGIVFRVHVLSPNPAFQLTLNAHKGTFDGNVRNITFPV